LTGGSKVSPPKKNDRGSTLVFAALLMAVILGFSAVAIDLGVIATARSQLQSAVDASTLAAASGLFTSQEEAIDRAITFAALNDCINDPVYITAANVSFPEENRARVEATHEIDLYFARVIGRNTATVHAEAEAEMGPISGTSRVKPWAIPDFDYVLGDTVLLKSGSSDPPCANSSFFYCIDFPPLNKGTPITGANEYGENIVMGSDGIIEIGDQLQVEPGNMIGPTRQGIIDVIAMDPDAYWDSGTNTIKDSLFPEFTSPRVCKVPMYDYLLPPEAGRNYVTVIRLGAFFLEEIRGNDVFGRFIEITTSGTIGPGESDLLGVKLVK
jgi:hypothetical protein